MKASLRLLIFALCIAATSFRCAEKSAPSSAEITAARAKIRAEASRRAELQSEAIVVAPGLAPRPEPPSVPRTVVVKLELLRLPQVYVDDRHMLAHRQTCRERTKSMLRMPLALARAQGYELHAGCENLKDPPQYREKVVTNPEWVAYEAKLAEYNRRIETQRLAELHAPASSSNPLPVLSPAVTYSPSSSPTSESSSEVQVKGYYRKDGTYVRPHTRSKPKK